MHIEDSIVLNSVIRESCQGEPLSNEGMGGEFPVLKPGTIRSAAQGGVTRPVVAPNRWYLS